MAARVDGASPCVALGLTLLIGTVDKYPAGLRLARDAEGYDLVLTLDEQRMAEARCVRERRACEG